MPYVFENPDSGEWENEFFWTPQQIAIPLEMTTNLEGQVQTAFGEQASIGGCCIWMHEIKINSRAARGSKSTATI